jgi:hypothetical protein
VNGVNGTGTTTVSVVVPAHGAVGTGRPPATHQGPALPFTGSPVLLLLVLAAVLLAAGSCLRQLAARPNGLR